MVGYFARHGAGLLFGLDEEVSELVDWGRSECGGIGLEVMHVYLSA